MNVEHSIFINIWYLRATVNILLWEYYCVWEKYLCVLNVESDHIIAEISYHYCIVNIYLDKGFTILPWEGTRPVKIVNIIGIINELRLQFVVIYHEDKNKHQQLCCPHLEYAALLLVAMRFLYCTCGDIYI